MKSTNRAMYCWLAIRCSNSSFQYCSSRNLSWNWDRSPLCPSRLNRPDHRSQWGGTSKYHTAWRRWWNIEAGQFAVLIIITALICITIYSSRSRVQTGMEPILVARSNALVTGLNLWWTRGEFVHVVLRTLLSPVNASYNKSAADKPVQKSFRGGHIVLVVSPRHLGISAKDLSIGARHNKKCGTWNIRAWAFVRERISCSDPSSSRLKNKKKP